MFPVGAPEYIQCMQWVDKGATGPAYESYFDGTPSVVRPTPTDSTAWLAGVTGFPLPVVGGIPLSE